MSTVEAQAHTLAGAYVCDALDEADRAAFERHLAQCPECAAEVGELREVAALMAQAVALRPPASLKAAVDARVQITRQEPPVLPKAADGRGRRSGGPRRRAGWAVAAAFALIAAGLGWRAIDQQNRIDALTGTSAQVSQLLSAPDAYAARIPVAGGGSALLVDSRSRDEAAVAFTGLAQPPAGKTYQLWLISPGGQARSVGLIPTVPTGPVLVDGLVGESRVGMTLEPAGGSPQPTSVPIMVAALGA